MTTLPLTDAVFFGDGLGRFYGEYSDGVIWADSHGDYPDFYFPGFLLDPAATYTFTVTFDPTSAHDGGGRWIWMTALDPASFPGILTTVYDSGFPSYFGNLYNDDATSTDVVRTITIGPGIGDWDARVAGDGHTAIWFETDSSDALLSISYTVSGGGGGGGGGSTQIVLA